jgi:hypothetical protein
MEFLRKKRILSLGGRIWWSVGGLSLIASFVNPAGAGVWTTGLGYIGNRYLVDHTAEYLSPNFHDPSLWPFLVFILLMVFLLGMNWLRLRPTHLILLTGWTAMGLYSTRNIPLFALIAAPIMAEGFAAAFRTRPAGNGQILEAYRNRENRLQSVDGMLRGHLWPIAVVALFVGLLAGGVSLDSTHHGNRFDPQVFPVAAANWLEANPPPGKMFNYFSWGGYLLYRLWPEQKVFIDGQTDFYGEDLTRQYEQVYYCEEGWQDVLARHQVQWAILPADALLAVRLRNDLGWRVIYQDETAVILAEA